MIVHHRNRGTDTSTEYRMAMDRTDFIALSELVKVTLEEIEPSKDNPQIGPFYALLYVMDHAMSHPVELP